MKEIMLKIKRGTVAELRNGGNIFFFILNSKLCYRLGMTCYYFNEMYNEDGTSKQNRNKDIMKVFLDGECWKRQDIDWGKVEIDAPLFVSNDGKTWTNANFAYKSRHGIYVFPNGKNSWTSDGVTYKAKYVTLPTKEVVKSSKRRWD